MNILYIDPKVLSTSRPCILYNACQRVKTKILIHYDYIRLNCFYFHNIFVCQGIIYF